LSKDTKFAKKKGGGADPGYVNRVTLTWLLALGRKQHEVDSPFTNDIAICSTQLDFLLCLRIHSFIVCVNCECMTIQFKKFVFTSFVSCFLLQGMNVHENNEFNSSYLW